MIRFFTTLCLRPGEEVDGSIVPHLPQHATVEFDGARPVTAVWQNRDGVRRIAWYGTDPAAVRDAHAERYDDEAFWLIDRTSATEVAVVECDAAGAQRARRVWTFDKLGQPATEDEHGAAGEHRASRRYRCLSDGFVVERRQRVAPSFEEQVEYRLPIVVAPELTAEPFPRGGTAADGAVRILDSLGGNFVQRRARSVWWSGDAWLPAITTLTITAAARLADARAALSFDDPKLGRLVDESAVQHPHRASWEPKVTAITELLVPGETVQQVVGRDRLPDTTAVGIALAIGEVASRARARGHDLGAIRPELVYLRDPGTGRELSGILHRAPALLAATRRDETFLWPPVFRSDFGSPDDVVGLAQLLWFMTTGGHPFLAPADVTWQDDWTELRHHERARQPWTGSPTLGPVLERALFSDPASRPSLAALLAELSSLVAGSHPYRGQI